MDITNINTASSLPPQMQAFNNDNLKPISLLALIKRLAPVMENQVIFAGDSLQASSKMSENGFICSKLTSKAVEQETPFLQTEEILGVVGQVTAVAGLPLIPLSVVLGGAPEIAEIAPLIMQAADTIIQTVQSGVSVVNGTASAVARTSIGVVQQQMTNSQASSKNLTENSSEDAKLMSQAFGANQAVATGVNKLISETGQAERAYKV